MQERHHRRGSKGRRDAVSGRVEHEQTERVLPPFGDAEQIASQRQRRQVGPGHPHAGHRLARFRQQRPDESRGGRQVLFEDFLLGA